LVWLVVDDLPVGALPIKQWLPVSVKQNGSYPANDDYVSVARQQSKVSTTAINSEVFDWRMKPRIVVF